MHTALAQIMEFPAVAQTSPSPAHTRQATAERQGPHTKHSKVLGPALPARERNEEGEGSGGERVHACLQLPVRAALILLSALGGQEIKRHLGAHAVGGHQACTRTASC